MYVSIIIPITNSLCQSGIYFRWCQHVRDVTLYFFMATCVRKHNVFIIVRSDFTAVLFWCNCDVHALYFPADYKHARMSIKYLLFTSLSKILYSRYFPVHLNAVVNSVIFLREILPMFSKELQYSTWAFQAVSMKFVGDVKRLSSLSFVSSQL